MKKLSIFAICALYSFSAWSTPDIESGQKASAVCAACHGSEGNSLVPQYPKLTAQGENYLKKQLNDFKLGASSAGKKGRYDPVMSAMASPLSDQDVENLAAYFSSLAPIDGQTPKEVVAQGKELYSAGDSDKGIPACTACHGPRGNGMNLAGFPKISGQHADYIKIQLEKFRDEKRNNDLNGMMRDVASKLTDEDIDVLSKYVGGLH